MIENFLKYHSNEVTIVLAHSKVAQKSYGSEKRYNGYKKSFITLHCIH